MSKRKSGTVPAIAKEAGGALPAHQERSRATRDGLLSAAEAILREKGEPVFTIAEVSARAGCSAGSVYRRFADKDALLHALLDRWTGEFAGRARRLLQRSNWEGRGIAEILESYLWIATRTTRQQGGLSRVILVLAVQDPSFAERANEAQTIIDRGLRRLLRARKKEIRHPQPDAAIIFVLEQLRASLMARRFGAPIHQASRLSDADFVREALASARRYLEL